MNKDESKVRWCLGKNRGISLIEPNENLSGAYVAKAKESIEVMRTLQSKSQTWATSACYYSIYYSLYAVMMKLGVKSEIHSCSITFMRYALMKFYKEEDIILLERAFGARIDHQYYVSRIPDAQKFDDLYDNAVLFYEKSQNVLSEIDEKFVKSVREKLGALKKRKR